MKRLISYLCDALFGYVFCVLGVVGIGAMVWLGSVLSVPVWAHVMIWGALTPFALLFLLLFFGGLYYTWGEWMKEDDDDK